MGLVSHWDLYTHLYRTHGIRYDLHQHVQHVQVETKTKQIVKQLKDYSEDKVRTFALL